MTNSEKRPDMELPPEIMPSTLSDWLKEGKDINIIDIRPKRDYQYWHIAESDNVEAYDELHRGHPGKLEDYQSDVPVVAVCYSGNSSKAASQYLRSKGIMATSLIGGMALWSSAWNAAAIPTLKSSAEIIQLRRTGKGCLSYIVGSDNIAVVIDPSVDSDVYVKFANENGWAIETVIDSHVHSDHVSRAKILAQQTGARYMLPSESNVSFSFEPINDGHPISFGSSSLLPILSSGHTAASMSLILDDEFLFSGDALFVSGISRPASADEYSTSENVQELAISIYETISNFSDLPQNLIVLPGHTHKPVPFDRIPISILLEEALPPILGKFNNSEEFSNLLISKSTPVPRTHAQIIRVNRSGEYLGGNILRLEGGENHTIIEL